MGHVDIKYWGVLFWLCDYLYIGCYRSGSLSLQRLQYQLHVHIWDWSALQDGTSPILQACNDFRMHLVHMPLLANTADKASRHVPIVLPLLYLCIGHQLCFYVLLAIPCMLPKGKNWVDKGTLEHPHKSFWSSSLSPFLSGWYNHLDDCVPWDHSNYRVLHGLRKF